MNKYNISISKGIMIGLLIGSHTFMSCLNNGLDNQTIESAGEKLATHIALSDKGLDTLPEAGTQQQVGMLESPYKQAINMSRQSGNHHCTNPEVEMHNRALSIRDGLGTNEKLQVVPINKIKSLKDYAIQHEVPDLHDLESNTDMPGFLMMSEKNGVSKSQLLEYINHLRNNHINVLLRGPGYTNSQINSKTYNNKINASFTDTYKDYGTENYDINETDTILAQVCGMYVTWNNSLLKRYQKVEHIEDVYAFYCEKEKKDDTDDTFDAFLPQLKNQEFKEGLVNFYIREKLKRLPPWEDMNVILKKYGLPYQISCTVGASNDTRGFSLMKNTQQSIIPVNFNTLSVDERLILDLMAWLFYFPELISKSKETAQIKNVVIYQLDESSRQPDPELFKRLRSLISNEFVQKRQTQVVFGLDSST